MRSMRINLLALLTLCAVSAPRAMAAGSMYIESCNLDCNSGSGGVPVGGQITSVFENQQLRVTFSLAVDLATVNAVSFRVFDVSNGTSPSGSYSVDLLDPRTVVFRPSLTFDSGGNPLYGFRPDSTYGVYLPGTAQGDTAPFIGSTTGLDNESRMIHTFTTDLGVQIPILVSCETSPNSVGPGALLQIVGSNSVSANSLSFLVASAPAQAPGIFFVGTQPRSLPMGQGLRCVGGRLMRLVPVMTDASGNTQHALDLTAVAPNPTETRFFQFWYRDNSPTGNSTSNLSNAVSVRFYP